MARVKTYVHVVHPKTRNATVLKPGDGIPKELEGAIKNPAAIEGGGVASEGGDEGGASEDDGDGYDDLKVTDLRGLLEGRGLDTSGNKDELIARLRDADSEG